MFQDEKGRRVIRLGDTTSHGGKVITGAEMWDVFGKPVARVGDKVVCPKCDNKEYEIVEGSSTMSAFNRPIAFDGHKTSCGATLISSLGREHSSTAMSQATNSSMNESTSTRRGYVNEDIFLGNMDADAHRSKNDESWNLLVLDERAILMRYYEAHAYMVKHDLRFRGYGKSPAIWNNFRAVFGGTYYRCQPQTLFVHDWLLDLDLNYDWDFNVIEVLVPYGEYIIEIGIAYHYLLEAVSPDKRIILRIDPLVHTIERKDTPDTNITFTGNRKNNHNHIAEINDERYQSGQKLKPRR